MFHLDDPNGPVPLPWRKVLAEVLAEAELRGFGTFIPGFDTKPGMGDQLADFIGARCDFLAHKVADDEWSFPEHRDDDQPGGAA